MSSRRNHRVAQRPVLPLLAVFLSAAVATSARAQYPNERLPVPDAAAQQEALAVVREVYKDAYEKADDPSARQALAKKLLGEGIGTDDNPAGRFVLLKVARDIATQAGDGATAFQAVEEMAKTYRVDALDMKAEILTQGAKMARASADHRSVAEQAADLLEQAVAEDNFPLADRLGELAFGEARKAGELELSRWIRDRTQEIREIAAAFVKAQEAEATLAEKPIDPEANLTVGRYRCFLKGDWETGAPMLALGGDADLKAHALNELKEPTTPTEQVQLGDGWAAVAESRKGLARRQILLRAAYWYRKAAPNLAGLEKARVEKSLLELDDLKTDWRRVVPWALAFDGVDDYVEVPTWKFEGDTPVTIEVVVMPGQIPGNVFAHVASDTERAGLCVRLANGRWEFLAAVGRNFAIAKSDGNVVLNRLVHLAGVWDGQMVRLYVDGRLQSKIAPAAGDFRPSRLPFFIGADPRKRDRAGGFFCGVISELRVSNVARYQRNFRPVSPPEPDENTIILLRLNEGQGTVARDSSGNNHHGAIQGAQWVRMPKP